MIKNKALIISAFIIGCISLFNIGCHDTTFVQGQRIYEYLCANCHMEDGSGLVKINPPVKNSDWLKNNQEKTPCLIRLGASDTMIVNSVVYHHEMIAFPKLSDVEITNVMNYMNHAWGNDYGERSINEIKAWLKGCE